MQLAYDNEVPSRAKAFLLWLGNKKIIAKFISTIMPSVFDSYYEPYLGSGAIFFQVSERENVEYHISDSCAPLIDCWLAIKKDYQYVREKTKKLHASHTYAQHQEIGENQGSGNQLERGADFLYLSRASWNGMEKSNDGGFMFKSSAVSHKEISFGELRDISRAIQNVDIQCRLASEVNCRKKGALFFVDPPYWDGEIPSVYKNRNYEGWETQKEVYANCVRWEKQGAKIIVMNNDNANIRKLFRGWKIRSMKPYRKFIRGGNNGREVILTNF